jgi:hypothetical protein
VIYYESIVKLPIKFKNCSTYDVGGPTSPKVLLPKKIGDIGTFGDMGTGIKYAGENIHRWFFRFKELVNKMYKNFSIV